MVIKKPKKVSKQFSKRATDINKKNFSLLIVIFFKNYRKILKTAEAVHFTGIFSTT